MPLFAAMGFDHAPHAMALRNKHRAAHRAYVLANAGMIRCAGAMRDAEGNQCGTIYVFDAADEQAIRDWLAAEPFHAAGVYETVRITLWEPAFNTLEQCGWPG